MNLCSDCRGTGVKPEPMQGQIFDPRFGRFCPCPVGQTKWLNTLNCVSDQETKPGNRPSTWDPQGASWAASKWIDSKMVTP